MKFTIDLPDEGRRLDQFLASKLSSRLSRTLLQKFIKTDGVMINQKLCQSNRYSLKLGDEVIVDLPDKKSNELIGEDIPLEILHEDEDILVVNKPSGLVVHPGAGAKKGTLVHALLGANKDLSSGSEDQRPGIVHRLDKDTSGLLLVAKNDEIHHKLAHAFSSRQIHKEYMAIVEGRIEHHEGQMNESIGPDPRQRTKRKVRHDDKAKEAMTEYQVVDRWSYSSLVRVFPKTGRTHQIRVHFAHHGHPVLYDVLYGRKVKDKRLALHAFKLKFTHPKSGEDFEIEAPLPEDFECYIQEEKSR